MSIKRTERYQLLEVIIVLLVCFSIYSIKTHQKMEKVVAQSEILEERQNKQAKAINYAWKSFKSHVHERAERNKVIIWTK